MSGLTRPSRDDVIAARTAAGHTQQKMAEVLGKTVDTVKGWETAGDGARSRTMQPDTFLLYQLLIGQITLAQARKIAGI